MVVGYSLTWSLDWVSGMRPCASRLAAYAIIVVFKKQEQIPARGIRSDTAASSARSAVEVHQVNVEMHCQKPQPVACPCTRRHPSDSTGSASRRPPHPPRGQRGFNMSPQPVCLQCGPGARSCLLTRRKALAAASSSG